jgi:hypothetical protein
MFEQRGASPEPGQPVGAEPMVGGPMIRATSPGLADPRALQILTTEHWSLLATRSLSWSETFSRGGMYLATLSAATVALALVAQASDFGEGFLMFALVVLPVVLFIGLATLVRIGQSSTEDLRTIQGMNRLRHAYLELVPELEGYFVMPWHDDVRGVLSAYGDPENDSLLSSALHGFVTTPGMISVLNSVVAAAIGGLAALGLGGGSVVAVVAGVATFALALGGQGLYGYRSVVRHQASIRPRFPSPASD